MGCEHTYYSVILKGCSRRENLARRLESVLLRGRLAIKMALDNIPSVIIYKGKTDSILPVLNAFKAESAAVTVLADGVPPALPVSKSYADFARLNATTQALLSHTPDNLWVGETIHQIVPAAFAGETGALAITSHALYFIDKPAGYTDCRWLAIAYGQLAGAPAANKPSGLTVTYQDATGLQTAIFHIEAEFLATAVTAIHEARAAKHYLVKLKTTCTRCKQTFEDYADTMLQEEYCRACGGQYQRTIIKP